MLGRRGVVEYAPILIFLAVATVFPVATLVIARLLRPSRYNKVKSEAYECGVPSSGEARARYPVRFYVIAVLFVVFDVETTGLDVDTCGIIEVGMVRVRGGDEAHAHQRIALREIQLRTIGSPDRRSTSVRGHHAPALATTP